MLISWGRNCYLLFILVETRGGCWFYSAFGKIIFIYCFLFSIFLLEDEKETKRPLEKKTEKKRQRKRNEQQHHANNRTCKSRPLTREFLNRRCNLSASMWKDFSTFRFRSVQNSLENFADIRIDDFVCGYKVVFPLTFVNQGYKPFTKKFPEL